jgi:calcium-dependent protein kinase
MAPELIKGDYDSKADMWSLGVITFMLLSSSMPFYGESRSAVVDQILHGKYKFQSKRWRQVSDDAKDYVKSLLRRRPEKRPMASTVLQESQWLCQEIRNSTALTDQELMDTIQASIQAFAGYKTLKKLALLVVAYKSTSEEIGFLRRMFSKFDTANDGEITYEEFRNALLDNYDYTEEETQSMFDGIDIDGTGNVHYMEFLAATVEAHGSIDEERFVHFCEFVNEKLSSHFFEFWCRVVLLNRLIGKRRVSFPWFSGNFVHLSCVNLFLCDIFTEKVGWRRFWCYFCPKLERFFRRRFSRSVS